MTLRILAAEDHPMMAKALRDLIEDQGWDVLVVPTGSDALKCWPDFAPDLVILDNRMPGMTGLEVARRLRSKIQIPIVLFSFDMTSATEQESRGLGLEPVKKEDSEGLLRILRSHAERLHI